MTVYDYGFRIYNPSIGKFLSVDPLTKEYAALTPYQFASDRPIDGIDVDGLEYLRTNTALFKFVGGITSDYVFKANDALVTNIDKLSVLINAPGSNLSRPNPYNDPTTVNIGERETTINWEKEQIPKSNNTALFSDFYKQMRNFNSQSISTNGNASYADPYLDPSQSKGATILNAIIEIYSDYQLFAIAQYFESHSTDIKEIRDAGAAFDNATRLVSACLKFDGLPDFFNAEQPKMDLVNFIIDGTTSDPDILSEYNKGIAAWGHALINNYEATVNGRLFRPMKTIISNGSTARDRDNTTVHQRFIIPEFLLNEDVRKAYEATQGLKPKSDEQTVQPINYY
jgi:hypothetical protein